MPRVQDAHHRVRLTAHTDAVWGMAYTEADTVFSVSADGSIKQWGATGQAASPNSEFPPPHTLGLVSVSASRDGQRVLYNSIEGLVSLWDVSNNKIAARFESYVRGTGNPEPCKLVPRSYAFRTIEYDSLGIAY